MKALTKHFFNKQPLRCENRLSESLRLSSWPSVHGLFIHVRMMKLRMFLNNRLVPALREVRVGLAALLLALVSKVNTRIFVGLGLMGVVAPLSACFYLLFNRVDYVPGWYHVNYFHLFFLLGPHLLLFFCLLGAFLLFPEGCKRGYMLAIPTGFNVAKIIWLIMATSNQDFWAVVPSSLILIGALISVVLFVCLDWLAYNKFHREDAFDARFDKLCELADEFDDAKFKSMIKTVWREKKAFQKQF